MPKEPKKDDPDFTVYGPELSPLERRTLQLAKYLKARDEYHKRYRNYKALQERSRAITQSFNADLRGFLLFTGNPAFETGAKDMSKSLAEDDRFFFTRTHKFELRETDRQRHTYITSGSGHGKSTSLETLVYQYLTREYTDETEHQRPAIILLDPHGDLAKGCAKLAPNIGNDRLVYIKPSLSRKLTPTLNPFDIKSTEWDDVNKATDALIEVFKEIMNSDGEGTSFTPQMVTLLKPCIAALLQMEGATFVDLMRFMDDDPSEHEMYLHYARRVLTNPMHLDALKKDFNKDSYNPSKLSIKTKIRNLLHDDYFYNFLVGKSTLDLEAEIARRAFIVFDLSGLTKKAQDAIGRFIMASINNIAVSRANIPYPSRIPTHLIVDECHNFVSGSMEKILTEARKYRLYGTFAQQFTGQGMNTQMRRAIIGNSYVKISGDNEVSSLKTISAETGIPIDELQSLKQGEFHVKIGTAPSVRVRVPMVPKTGRMTGQQWGEVKIKQIEKYYRLIHSNTQTAVDEEPAQEATSRTPVVQEAEQLIEDVRTKYTRKPRNPLANK